jgi:hypothetical protein
MFKQLNIMLCFLLLFAIEWATAQDNFKVFVPEFIPANGTFQISLITSRKFPEADRLNIYFLPELSLIINKVELLTNESKLQVPIHSELIQNYSALFQKVSIELNDTIHFSDANYFQFIVTLTSTQTEPNSLKFFGKFLNGEVLLGYLKSSDSKIFSEKENVYNLSFKYYQKFPTAEYSAAFSQDSYLNIPLVYDFENKLAIEFWIKVKNSFSTFMKIINWETNRTQYFLSLSSNQMIVISSNDNELLTIKPFFISENVWYHFNFILEKQTSEIVFFCEGLELSRFKVNNYLEFDNLVLHFQNETPNSEFYLDQLRLINLKNSYNAISRNKNYPDYSNDSSNVIFQMNFSENELANHLSNKTIFYEKIRFAKSDAPLFPRAPKVSVKVLNNFYEIEWNGGSYKDADYYILERAIGNGEFKEAGKQPTDKSEEKVYSLISEILNQSDILYFRIKQINKNGSVVYSDAVKVGQGIIEDVILGQNYPNPFNPVTLIEFELLMDSDVELKVFDLSGKEIALLHKGYLARGVHQFKFDASGFTSGIYLYQITTPLSSQTKKMILAK